MYFVQQANSLPLQQNVHFTVSINSALIISTFCLWLNWDPRVWLDIYWSLAIEFLTSWRHHVHLYWSNVSGSMTVSGGCNSGYWWQKSRVIHLKMKRSELHTYILYPVFIFKVGDKRRDMRWGRGWLCGRCLLMFQSHTQHSHGENQRAQW